MKSINNPHGFARLLASSVLLVGLAACGGGNTTPTPSGTSQAAVLNVNETVSTSAVTVGSPVTWTVAMSNSGNAATSSASTLLINMPTALSGLSVVPTGASCSAASGTMTCTVPAGLAAGASASVTFSGTTTANGTLTSSVQPSGAAATGCVSTADCSTTTTVNALPNVTIASAVNSTNVLVGSAVNWTITALNSGGPTTSPISVTDTWPASGIGIVTVTPTGASCGPIVNGNTLNCTISPGLTSTNGPATIAIATTASSAGSLVNTVTPGTGATCPSGAACTTTTSAAVPVVPNVTVSSSVNATSGLVGSTITWTLTATNSGAGASTAPITLTDTLPAADIGSVAVTPVGATCSAITGNTLTCTIPAGLAANGGTASVVATTTATAVGTLVNTVAPGSGASCTSTANCTSTTTISSGSQIAGSCGLMTTATTLDNDFGGSAGTMVGLTGLGTTSSAGPDSSSYLVGMGTSGDPVTVESWPGTYNGPASGTMVVAQSGQFICASQNATSATVTGASSTVKYTSDLTSPTSGSPTSLAGNIQISKAQNNPGFVMFNLPSLSNFSFEFFRAGSNGYQIDYSTDGTTWHNIVTTSTTRAACTNDVCDESDLLTTSPSGATSFTATAPITVPVLLRLENINTSGTMVIQKLMIQP
jgi:uncharacterized repeat protein (TIGR01451 family)